jgi:hypothetical protein
LGAEDCSSSSSSSTVSSPADSRNNSTQELQSSRCRGCLMVAHAF